MKAVSLWQPWASLLVHGIKRVETRGRRPISPGFRGKLLVHSAKVWTKAIEEIATQPPFLALAREKLGVNWPIQLPRGRLLGWVEVTNCLKTEEFRFADSGDYTYVGMGGGFQAPKLESELGDFSEGRYGFLIGTCFAFPEPIACQGRQGVWAVPDDVIPEAWR